MNLENENPINKLHKNYILKIKDNKKTTYIKAFAFEPNEKKWKNYVTKQQLWKKKVSVWKKLFDDKLGVGLKNEENSTKIQTLEIFFVENLMKNKFWIILYYLIETSFPKKI